MLDDIKKKLRFETFTEFCDRADEMLKYFQLAMLYPNFSMNEYKNYIYYGHKFSMNSERDLLAKDKIFEYLMSYKYEYVAKNDLYSVLGFLKKGQ